MEVSENSGDDRDIESLAEGLEVVAKTGLIPTRLADAAESKPALARLLSRELFGADGDSYLVRAGQLEDVLGTVLDRLGDGPRASAADYLLSISPEYRGRSYNSRFSDAALAWKPDGYAEDRNFGRMSKKIIRDVAGELALYQEEQLRASEHGAEEQRTTGPPSEYPAPSRRPPRRRRRIFLAVGAVLVVAAAAVAVPLIISAQQPSHHSTPNAAAASAREIEQRYDGMDPQGKNGPQSKCSDPPPSQPVIEVHPSVIGPDGKPVGYVELRTSPICQVLWARVYWSHGSYAMPPGWSLHILMHRSVDPKVVEDIRYDTSKYDYGNMIATVRGCAYAEVFFAKGSQRTPSAKTPCMRG